MLNEILCLCISGATYHTDHLMPLDKVPENESIVLAFYHPDHHSDRGQINQLQANGVHLVALVDADDDRQLPEQAFSMICCDDARLIAELICDAVTNGLLRIDLVDLLTALSGCIFDHQRCIGTGDQRIDMIIDQSKSIRSSRQLCIFNGDFGFNEQITFLSACEEAELLFYSLDSGKSMGNEAVVDVLYSRD